ncbi:MAG: hypothetical protein KDD59_11090 [Bdellovibrionales bacterium]|nr:hypothetical protein [Bdellovibrionales bacterium]
MWTVSAGAKDLAGIASWTHFYPSVKFLQCKKRAESGSLAGYEISSFLSPRYFLYSTSQGHG